MRFRINEIGDEGLALNLPLTAEWLAAECPDLDATPAAKGGLTFRGRLSRVEDDVFLRGAIRGALACTCARCLEPAKLPLDLPVNVTFVAREEASADADEEDEDEDVDVAPFDGDEVDIGPQLREHIILAMPINPLCRESCAGLCPFCGGNRNQIPCDCASRQETPRTPLAAVLGKLKM